MSPQTYQMLADAVLALHVAVVLFVIGGLIAVFVGNLRGWSWVNSMLFRVMHLVAIGVVVVQAWLGQSCPLTILEVWLREQAGQATYSVSFIEYWLQRILYYEAPTWVFTVAYTAFGLLVVATWILYPPRRGATSLN